MKVTPGTVLTVGGGVSLTLRNITFEGAANNTTPLLKVGAGGKLILEDGVKLINNITTADAGGVWVNGGALILNSGVEITGMEARRAGGVLVDALGNFIMSGGTIGRKDYGNTASEENGGGGVLVASGSFDMNGGTIEHNSALEKFSGGGVCVLREGTFNLNIGTLKKNTAQEVDSGGGVCVISDYNDVVNFVMNGAGALIDDNTAKKARSGGGLYGGGLQINSGTIAHNKAEAEYSGGGVFSRGGQLNGGTIAENTAWGNASGGGVCVANSRNFSVTAGAITGNIAQGAGSGGGVYVDDNGLFELGVTSGSHTTEVKDNIAYGADSGGGVYVAGWTRIYDLAEIQGNKTPTQGVYNCGVYVENTAPKAFEIDGSAKVTDDNIVFLAEDAVINFGRLRILDGEFSANIIHENPISGITRLLWTNDIRTVNGDYVNKFLYNGSSGKITPEQGTGGDASYWYGIYTE
jgi:hypothetical protein